MKTKVFVLLSQVMGSSTVILNRDIDCTAPIPGTEHEAEVDMPHGSETTSIVIFKHACPHIDQTLLHVSRTAIP